MKILGQMIVGEEEIHIKDLYYVLMKNNLGNVKVCKTLIQHGHVKVNGLIIYDVKFQVSRQDHIEVHDQRLNSQPFVYYMLNKPKGYVCANHDQIYPCVIDIIGRKDCYCVGRLDKDTTGLLLITNDPSLSKRLLLPQYHVYKTYEVTTLYPLSEDIKKQFQNGVVIDQNILCLPAQIKLIDSHHCFVTIKEGKYHQVKKMFLSCQNQVTELKRVGFSHLTLDEELKEGEYRHLTDRELSLLLEMKV